MSATYDGDVVAWANEQAALIGARKLHLVDIEHVLMRLETWAKATRVNWPAAWLRSSLRF